MQISPAKNASRTLISIYGQSRTMPAIYAIYKKVWEKTHVKPQWKNLKVKNLKVKNLKPR
jgi:hypothetical protein